MITMSRNISFFAFLVTLAAAAAAAAAKTATKSPWQTLTGNAPGVIARGGFSGLFPDSSAPAWQFTYQVGSPDSISWCDVQLTQDGVGVCLPSMLLDNCTNVQEFYPNGQKKYELDGVVTSGWFSVDFVLDKLNQVSVVRSTLSRSDKFDASLYPILKVEDVKTIAINQSAIWLNIQHDIFYTQHNLSMRTYLLSLSKRIFVDYVSSPEVGFLSSIGALFKRSKTKIVFRFLNEDVTEPSTNQTYASLLKNLTFIKTIASGILVPKHYIWPVTADLYLQPSTSIVMDAHKAGLEIYASDFANDGFISYNFSYDPVAEYLAFVDNGIFSVDGVLTDFPITASEAIGCFSHIKNNSEHGNPLVITHNGASGIYPDCTDLAYQQAVEDGADFIDCPVQVTKDGTLVCMSSVNLMDTTNIATSSLRSASSVIPEIQGTSGIFTFNFTLDEIQKNLKPAISNPQIHYGLYRNPRYKNAGNFMKLSDFLAYAKGKPLSGIMISIEYAAFLADNLGYSVTDAVIAALKDAGFHNQTTQEVMIQSTNSSVLSSIKQQTNYNLVYTVDESISNADASSLANIKKFARSVAVNKHSIYPVSQAFITGQTDLVKSLQSAGLSVFVYVLQNEYVSQPWDFFSDPTVEINSFVQRIGVDGIITDFPGTATRYRKNTCSKLGVNMPNYMVPVEGGSLLTAITPAALPPAMAPLPVLDVSDVMEPPLPSASLRKPTLSPTVQPSAGPLQCTAASSIFSFAVAMLSGSLLLLLKDY